MFPEMAGLMKTFGVFLLILPIVAVWACVYPIFTIIHCIRSDRGSTSKVIWILFMIFIWPFASFFYGLFASQSRRSQIICTVFIVFSVGAAILFAASYIHIGGKLDTLSEVEVNKAIGEINALDTSGLSEQQLNTIKKSLETLKSEVKFGKSKFSVANLKEAHKASSLLQLYNIIAEDKRITLREHEMWINKFDTRHMIDMERLANYVKSKAQFKTAPSVKPRASTEEKRTYYKNRQIKDIVQYKNGKLHGVAKKYYEDGTLAQEAVFKDGKLGGIGKIYYTDGSIEAEYRYENGKKVGIREYNRDGSIAYEENF